jgi:hypothetical protein
MGNTEPEIIFFFNTGRRENSQDMGKLHRREDIAEIEEYTELEN